MSCQYCNGVTEVEDGVADVFGEEVEGIFVDGRSRVQVSHNAEYGYLTVKTQDDESGFDNETMFDIRFCPWCGDELSG